MEKLRILSIEGVSAAIRETLTNMESASGQIGHYILHHLGTRRFRSAGSCIFIESIPVFAASVCCHITSALAKGAVTCK